jgi:type I restriction enzyme S subunit
MIANRLRKSILLAAIQGKLTEQNSASENTLKEFSKDTYFYSSIKIQDKPFCIPENWAWAKISTLIKLGNGEKMKDTEHKYLDVKFLRGKSDKEIKNEGRYIKTGTKIILVDGENSGEVFYVSEEGYMGSTFRTLELKYDNIWEYLKVFLDLHRDTFRNSKIGSAIPHLNKQLFNNLLVPLPPFNEQQRIINKLETLLPLIDSLKKHEQDLNDLIKHFPESMKASILAAAIQGKITDQLMEDGNSIDLYKKIKEEKSKSSKIKVNKASLINEESPFKIPDNWLWTTLDDISIRITSGGTPSRTNPRFWHNGTIPWLKIKDINSKYIEKAEEFITEEALQESSAKFFPKGTILYTIFATIGDCGILNFDSCTNQAIAGITLVDKLVSKEYIYYVLLSSKTSMMSKSRGMAQFNINQEILKKLQIPLPPLKEQERIVKKLNEILPIFEKIDYKL